MFTDRADAGRRLATLVADRMRLTDPTVVLGLPRGGVVVAAQVADALDLPLDVIVIRKLGVPGHSELAMGAIGEDGQRILEPEIVERVGVTEEQIADVEARERAVLTARVHRLREGRPRPSLTGRTALLVDDGIATGASARIAAIVARRLGAQRVVLAVPVAPVTTVRGFDEADEVIAVERPQPFYAIGAHYRDFSPVSDDEVVALLRRPGR